jgi:hypothetical protein
MHRIKISNRGATQRCNVSAFFYAKICSLLARRRSSQAVQRVYWPENVIDWLARWRPTCVMRHARGQKLQSFRHKWPFYIDLYSMIWECVCMNSARKDGRSFWKARTFTEETEAIRTAIPSSTRYKNKWAVEVFKEWQYYRATKGETSSEVDDNVQTVDTPFQ